MNNILPPASSTALSKTLVPSLIDGFRVLREKQPPQIEIPALLAKVQARLAELTPKSSQYATLSVLAKELECAQDTLNQAETIFQASQKLGFAFEGFNRKIGTAPFVFDANTSRTIRQFPGIAERLIVRQNALIQGNTSIQNNLQISPEEANRLETPLFVSLQFIMGENGELKIIETEPTGDGYGECEGTMQVFDQITKNPSPFPWIASSLSTAIDTRFSGKNIVFVENPNEPWYSVESQFLAKETQNRSAKTNISFATDADLTVTPNWVFIRWARVDVIINRFSGRSYENTNPVGEAIKELWLAKKVECFPAPINSIGNKLWCSEYCTPNFWEWDQATASLFPVTTPWDNTQVAPANAIIKRGISRVWTKDVFDTQGTLPSTISQEVAPWIAQEKIKTQTRSVAAIERRVKWGIATLVPEDMKAYWRGEAYIVFPSKKEAVLAWLLVTCGPKAIVYGGRDTVMVPGQLTV